MDTIPSIYWMIIIGAITFMICFVLYYVAMLLKESKEAVTDSRALLKDAQKTIKQVDLIINDVQSSISSVRSSIDEINQTLLIPIRKIGYGISVVSSFLGKKKENGTTEE